MKPRHECAGCGKELGDFGMYWLRVSGRALSPVPVCRDRRVTKYDMPKQHCVARFIAKVAAAAAGGGQ